MLIWLALYPYSAEYVPLYHLEFLDRILRQNHGGRNERGIGVDQPSSV